MYTSDTIRKDLFESAIQNKGLLNERVSITLSENTGVYTEIIKESEFRDIFTLKPEYQGMVPLQIAESLVNERISAILEEKGFIVDPNIDYSSSDFYDGYELKVPFRLNESFDEDVFFEELDAITDRKPYESKSSIAGHGKPDTKSKATSYVNGVPKPAKNKVTDIPLNQEPSHGQVNHLPNKAKREKTQNPRKVDLLLKSVFESKFLKYVLQTDIGGWKAIKTLKNNGKLVLTWENVEENKITIETLIFPDDSNKIIISVKNAGEVMIDYFLEIYRIPTDAVLVEKFFRKTYFNLLKKFIETRVIQIEPFATRFIFWKTDNPFFSYSFSSPKKNKIIKDLIAFIGTAKKPILDDFFEQNNLKHKQGYLQTLLDSAEAAGIFKFAREGNEIVILKGPNYKAFLEGRIRRVAT